MQQYTCNSITSENKWKLFEKAGKTSLQAQLVKVDRLAFSHNTDCFPLLNLKKAA